ncbi:MAG: hypothetical protein AAGG72_00350 [Pseudomonadota bacterium]
MPRELKAAPSTQAECFRLGGEIRELQGQQRNLQNDVAVTETEIAELRFMIAEIEQEIANIQFAEDTARAEGSRAGIGGVIASEVTAGAIRLAMQKDSLERERDQRKAGLSRLERQLNDRRRRLEEVGYLLSRLHDAFVGLGCSASTIPF